MDNRPEPPDVQRTRPNLQVASSRRIEALRPVLFRLDGQWRFGIIEKWIKTERSPWIATIRYGSIQDFGHFDYRDDGAILRLQLDTSSNPPTLRPTPKQAKSTAKGQ